MSKIEQNKALKRQGILAAAQAIFLSEGFEHTSMDKVAASAGITKQTLYRYYSSKLELFEATLMHMGQSHGQTSAAQLEKADNRDALFGFAKEYMTFHLSDSHIATFRLLVAESTRSPEIVSRFMSVGPDETDAVLAAFFSQRFAIKNADAIIRQWTSLLLAQRSAVLLGMAKPTAEQIEKQAMEATDFLLAAIR